MATVNHDHYIMTIITITLSPKNGGLTVIIVK